jgi:hypothetical protein
MNGWTNVGNTFNGKLFSLEKEENSDLCYSMNQPEDSILSELSKSQKIITMWFHVCEVLKAK